MEKTLAVVVTYNRKKLLEECIQALLNQKYSNFDILILDNKSTDDTEEYIKKYVDNKKVYYKKTEKNLGGAGGFNLGMRYAYEHKYDFCWVMDDDTIPTENALSSLVSKREKIKNNFSFLCSVVNFEDGTICKMNIPQVSSKYIYDVEKIKENNLLKVDYCSFVSCYVNMKMIEKCGLPIKEFFIYGDDVEFTERLSNEEKAFLDLDSIVVHKMTKNTNTDMITTDKEKLSRAFYTYRNRFFMAKKSGKKEVIKYSIRYFTMFYRILRHSPNYKFARIRVLTKGYFAGLFFHPNIEKI